MVSLSPLCVFEEQAPMKCKTGQRSSTRHIVVIAKPRYQGPAIVRVRAGVCVCEMINVCKSVCLPLCICRKGRRRDVFMCFALCLGIVQFKEFLCACAPTFICARVRASMPSRT